MPLKPHNIARYGRYLLFISGLGGLLYGIDVGIIAAALLYLGKTVNLSVQQTSLIVAAVLGGGTLSSLVAGFLADWVGRKRMMVLSGLLFVVSVGLIVVSQGFVPLFLGRLLQGVSGGFIAVVVPLYLAECLGPEVRGRGTAIFQFALTFGIVIAALTGFYFTRQAEAAILAAGGDPTLIRAAQDHAWRTMFLSVVYPGVLFCVGSFFLSETPRWLFRKGRSDQALASLRRTSTEEQAQLQMREMAALAAENTVQTQTRGQTGEASSLLQRKYVFPFLLACFILSCNQTTGINSVLGFLVVILKQAGMTAQHATQGDVAVKLLNCVVTLAGVAFVDRKGRKFLLKTGTAGVVLSLLLGALLFFLMESGRLAPSQQTGWLVTACLGLFIAAYAFGPGVVVWLMLSELMPTRIRSVGMGIALLLNQGVSTAIAALFLPVVARYGYHAMFLFWALCSVAYFLAAAFLLPETKGRTLEEIESSFDGHSTA